MKRHLSLLLLVLAAVAGCQKTEPNTEIVLEIATNIPVPAGMNTLSLKVTVPGKPDPLAKKYPLGTGAGQIMLPRRMTLFPLDNDTGTTFSVLVEGLLDSKTVVSRLVITKFAKGESKLLRIELLQKCVGQVCPNNQTCTPSAFCADPNIDPANLPTFDSSKAPNTPGLDPDAGVSIDAPFDQSAGDGKTDGLYGKDGLPNPDRGASDGPPGYDVTPNGLETSVGIDGPTLNVDGPEGTVIPPAPDGSVDGPKPVDGPVVVVNPDTGGAVDTPVKIPDVPPVSKTKGVACGLSSECESGLCIDGVCCESKCEGLCMACNVPGKLGTCAMVPLNDPSNGDCPDDGVATCGRNGRCNGAGGCMMYPMGVACSAETCPAGTSNHMRPGLCDGQGRCGQGQLQDCAPFLCNPTTKGCNPTCTVDTDCVAPNRCINGSCGKKSEGLPCSAPGDCQSNICAQGVCCAGPCTDLCKSCAVEGSLGICTSVLAGKPDVQGRCQDQGVNTCGTNGLCDGTGVCQKYGENLVCGNQCNGPAATFTTSSCSAGTCTPGAPQPCSPYSCDNSGCKKSCAVPSDCAPGFVCGTGGLCVRPPEDCMNGIDDDGDGQIDCADPDCQAGFMCMPTVPDGFTGPVELFEGAQANVPACGGAYPAPIWSVDHYGSLQCPSASCNPCRCDLNKDATCSNPLLGFYTLKDCTTSKPTAVPPEDWNKCLGPMTTTPTVLSATAGRPTGSCATAGGDAIVPLPSTTWNTARLCGGPGKGGAGCANGFVCWPRPQGSFRTQACVVGTGNCPSSGYSDRHDYFDSTSVSDTRSCISSCSCGGLTGTCPGSLELFTSANIGREGYCSSLNQVGDPMKFPTGCVEVPGKFSYYRVNVPDPPLAGGSCAATGNAVAVGGCSPAGNQATVCCTP